METDNSYCRRRFLWTTTATFAQLRRWSWIVDVAAVPFIGYALLKLFDYIAYGGRATSHFLDWLTLVPELGVWSILYTIPSGIVVFIAHLTFNWFRAPGKLDEQLRGEFERAIQQVRDDARNLNLQHETEIESLKDKHECLHQKVKCFEKRLRPNIWITGKVYRDSPIADVYTDGGGMNVGFTLENRSDSELHDVRVELLKMDLAFPDTYYEEDRFITYDDMGHTTNFPIVLEWSPDEQISKEVSCTTIPAGASRLVGLFSEAFVLSASHAIRPSLGVSSSFVYRVAVRISAKKIPTITSRDYIVSRINKTGAVVRVQDIPYEIEPKDACELMNPRSEGHRS